MIEQDAVIQRRIDMDLLSRSMTGVVVYAFLLPAVFWPFDFHILQPSLSAVFASSMLVVSLLRVIHKLFTAKLYDYSPRLWRSIFILLSLCHAGILSTFFALSIYDERFASLIHVTMLAMGGICSGAVFALNPRINIALTILLVLVGPSIVISLLSVERLPFAGMLSVYFGYIAMIGIRSSKEYIRSYQNELKLDEQKKVLEKQSSIDALTDIYNRGYFNREFEKQWDYARRLNLTVSLMLIDVDHFKSFNDNYGHLLGDACLVHIAHTIGQFGQRQTDIVARFGGEEFVVLIIEKDTNQVAQVAERIRANIEQTPFHYHGQSYPVTASVGVASMRPTPNCESKQLVERADVALYEAKGAGRNCVRVFQNQAETANTGELTGY